MKIVSSCVPSLAIVATVLLVAGTGSLDFASAQNADCLRNVQQADVVIVGAGITGVRAAARIREIAGSSLNVVVLESSKCGVFVLPYDVKSRAEWGV